MSVLRVKNGDQWDIVPAIKGDTGDPAADESITDDMLVPDGIKTEIDWLWGNQLMDIRDGELLQTNDAYEGPLVSLDVDGNSTQVTTTGKNLLDVTAYTASGARIYANGNVASVGGWYVSEYMDVSGMTGVARSGFASNNGVRDAFYDSEKELLQVITHTPTAVDVPSGAVYMRCSYNGNDRINGTMQYESGAAPSSYEPYTNRLATPCPDYPQPIHSIDSPKLQVRGKNLFPASVIYDDTVIFMAGGSCTVDGILFTFTATSSDMYFGSLTNGGTQWNARLGALLPVVYGNDYLFEVSNADFKKNYVVWYDENLIARGSATITSNTATLSVPSANIKWASLRVGNGSAVSGTTYETTIFFGTAYEPYAGHTVSLLPDGYSLRSLPNGTKDELHLSYLRPSTREGWAWYDRELVQRVGHVDLGTLTWTSEYSGDQQKWIAVFTNATNSAWISKNMFMCSGYKVLGSQAILADFTDDVIMHRALNARTVMVHDSRYISDTTPEQFRAAVDGVIWQYPLATPVTTTLDPIELPIMPSKDTTIWSDPATNLKMTYIQDTNLVIESLEATVADMATS